MSTNAATHRIRLFLCCLLLLACPAVAAADAARDQYFQAENAYRKMLDSPTQAKYRHHWLRVIEAFRKVYDRDPVGAWAAAGLYRAGLTYLELHQRSGLAADRDAGLAHLEKVRQEFPDSAYRTRAEDRLRDLPQAKSTPPASPPKPSVESSAMRSARRSFQKAEDCQARLAKNSRRTKHRDVWLTCIDQYRQTYEADPEGPLAAASLYHIGTLYQQLADYSRSRSDRETAVSYLSRVSGRYADSPFGPMAEAALDGRSASAGETAAGAQENPPPSAGASSQLFSVSGLRYWSNPNYSRVVVDTSGKTPYFHHLLKKDPDLKKPQRLYVDLQNARLAKDFPRVVPINDDLLMDARAGQFQSDTVRVVVDLKSFKTYKIFSLMNPFRIVIDVWGEGGSATGPSAPPPAVNFPNGTIPPGSIARSLALGVRRIVVDAGHGGKDPGARGLCGAVQEKDITLSLAKRLKKKLEARLGCQVLMTRDSDIFLTLEERTALANTKEADLFVSLHVNAHRNKDAYGIETYFLNLATDEESIRVAAMENATSTKNISDLQTILMDLMQNAKINESSRLASYVQTNMVGYLQKHYSTVRDKGVKQAPFYVLLGAQMPAILVETSFISNPRDCKRLTDPAYQDKICDGILFGIEAYIKDTSPTAFQEGPHPPRQDG